MIYEGSLIISHIKFLKIFIIKIQHVLFTKKYIYDKFCLIKIF